MFSFSLSLRLCLLVGLSSSFFHTIQARSHDFQAGHHRRSNKDVFPQTGNFTNAEILGKRGGDKKFSWYQTGQYVASLMLKSNCDYFSRGACGGFNGPDDFVSAGRVLEFFVFIKFNGSTDCRAEQAGMYNQLFSRDVDLNLVFLAMGWRVALL